MSLQLSLRTKIIGMVIGIMSLTGGVCWWNTADLGADYERSNLNAFQGIIKGGGDRLAAQFFERYGDVQAFAINDVMSSGHSDKITERLDQYVGLYGLYDLILFVDTHGKLIAANTKDVAGKDVNLAELKKYNFSEEAWFKASLAGQFTEDKSKGFVGTYVEEFMEDPMAPVAFSEKRLGSSFSAPVKDEKGNVIGVISNRAGSRWITKEFDELSRSLKQINSKGNVVLVDSKGVLLYAQTAEQKPLWEDQFFKKNMVETSPIVKRALAASAGAGADWSDTLKAQAAFAFTNLEGPKWIETIGWRLIVVDRYDEIMSQALSAEHRFYLFLIVTLFIAIAFATWFAMAISKRVASVSGDLAKNASHISSESTALAASATELSESSTEQAAALQETVAAVDQIFAMVEKNADAANRSKDYSNQSRENAEHGKQIVESMLKAISEIDSANNEISDRVESGNQQLSEITTMIKEIGAKTKVINDIVFQTKLLSFNASVEAARAGEYGKGFAVVAEEVGNLAQMSGNAAKEISTLLDESVKKVESIIGDTKQGVEKVMLLSKEKVDAGSQTANECAAALEQILQNVANVDSMVNEIAVASREQSMGIKEISKAVGQMEQVIQQNTAVAHSSSTSSEQLRMESVGLEAIVGELQLIVTGNSDKPGTKQEQVASRATNVVDFKPRKKVEPQASSGEQASEAPAKIAVGADFVPDANDPGFDE